MDGEFDNFFFLQKISIGLQKKLRSKFSHTNSIYYHIIYHLNVTKNIRV